MSYLRVGQDATGEDLKLHYSAQATVTCAHAFAQTGLRPDLAGIRVPARVVQGQEDRTVPSKNSGDRTKDHLPHATYTAYCDAPHGLIITGKDKLTCDLIDFVTTTDVRGGQVSERPCSSSPALRAGPGFF